MRVFIDLDGVLRDVVRDSCANYQYYSSFTPLKIEQLSSPVVATDAMTLLRMFEDPIILTKNPDAGEWCTKFFSNRPVIIVNCPKCFCSRSGDLLIDDCDMEIREWRIAGGVGIVWPQKWNTFYHRQKSRLDYLESELKRLNIKFGR